MGGAGDDLREREREPEIRITCDDAEMKLGAPDEAQSTTSKFVCWWKG